MAETQTLTLRNVPTVGSQFIHVVDEKTGARFPQFKDGVNTANKYVLKVGLLAEEHSHLIAEIESLLMSVTADSEATRRTSPLLPRRLPKKDESGQTLRDSHGKEIWIEDPTALVLTIRSRERFTVMEKGQEIGGEAVQFPSGTRLDVHISEVKPYTRTDITTGESIAGIYFVVDHLEVLSRPERVSIPHNKRKKKK